MSSRQNKRTLGLKGGGRWGGGGRAGCSKTNKGEQGEGGVSKHMVVIYLKK